MNSRALTDKIKNLSNKNNITHHLLLSNYFFETIVERIENSKYKNVLVIHGGYLLGLFFGIKSRSTKDIDISLICKDSKNKDLKFVKSFIKEILDIDLKDNIRYEFNGNIERFKTDRINGYRIKLTGYKDTLRQHFSIDLTIDYLPHSKLKLDKFNSIINDKPLRVLHPIFEKVIAINYMQLFIEMDKQLELETFMIYIFFQKLVISNILKLTISSKNYLIKILILKIDKKYYLILEITKHILNFEKLFKATTNMHKTSSLMQL